MQTPHAWIQYEQVDKLKELQALDFAHRIFTFPVTETSAFKYVHMNSILLHLHHRATKTDPAA